MFIKFISVIVILKINFLSLIDGENVRAFCPIERSTTPARDIDVIWNATSSQKYHYSRPMCLDKSKIPFKRFCNESGWYPAEISQCEYTQVNYKNMERCPPPFDQLFDVERDKKFCVYVTEPEEWSDKCLQFGSHKTVFDLAESSRKVLVDHLIEKGHTKFWIPANRTGFLDRVVWRLPTLWGETVSLENFHQIDISTREDPGNCMYITVTNKKIIGGFERCQQKLPMLCLYRDKPLLRLGCDKYSFTTRYLDNQNICYTIQQLDDILVYGDSSKIHLKCSEYGGQLYQSTSPSKNYIFQRLARLLDIPKSDHCAISVIPGEKSGQFSWKNWNSHLNKIDFIAWDMFIKEGSFVTINRDGEWTLENSVECVACEKEIQIEKPEISLSFDINRQRLFMSIINQQFLWRETDPEIEEDEDEIDEDQLGVYCFMTVDNESTKKVEIGGRSWSGNIKKNQIVNVATNYFQQIKKSIYEIEIDDESSGFYWCEGHAIPNFSLVQSKRVFVARNSVGTVFSTLVNLWCPHCIAHVTNKTFLNELTVNLTTNLRSVSLNANRFIAGVEMIKIESIGRISKTISFLYHITCAISDETDEESSEEDDEIDEVGIPSNILSIYWARKLLWHYAKAVEKTSDNKFLSINHTEYCLPENLVNTEVNWISARIHETTVPKELCISSNGLPISRRCHGDFVYGGVWDKSPVATCNLLLTNTVTYDLFRISESRNLTEVESYDIVKNLTEIVLSNRKTMIPADLFYLSRVLSNVATADVNGTDPIEQEKSRNITEILSQLMLVNGTTIRQSQTLNTTNIILDSYSTYLSKISVDICNTTVVNYIDGITNLKDGTILIHLPKLIVMIIDPSVKNISGLALYHNSTKSRHNGKVGDFRDYYVKSLNSRHHFHSIENIGGYSDDLEVGSYIPQDVIDRLTSMTTISRRGNRTVAKPPLRIVITLHYDDALFQENANVTHEKSGSIIISVSVPGYDSNLRGALPIFFKQTKKLNETEGGKPLCGYWDFSPENRTVNSEWAVDGCRFEGIVNVPNPVQICYCTHLTHFALLVQGYFVHDYDVEDNYVIIEQIHHDVLDTITLAGCSLSLIGILGIYLTALTFKSWREKANAKILLQLSGAIGLQMFLMCLVSAGALSLDIFSMGKWSSCIFFGASLHYSVLVVFSWMLITAYLQFVRYVRVLGNQRPARFFLKSFIIGWCAPLIPVILVIVIDPESYIPPGAGTESKVCYPSGNSLYFGVLAPIGLIVIANLVVFIFVIYNIFKGPDVKIIRSTERDLTVSQLRLSIFLFFLLGLSWIFGLAAASNFGIVFSYLFCITATLQGFILFIYFIIMDPCTRKLWSNFLCKHQNPNKIKDLH